MNKGPFKLKYNNSAFPFKSMPTMDDPMGVVEEGSNAELIAALQKQDAAEAEIKEIEGSKRTTTGNMPGLNV